MVTKKLVLANRHFTPLPVFGQRLREGHAFNAFRSLSFGDQLRRRALAGPGKPTSHWPARGSRRHRYSDR